MLCLRWPSVRRRIVPSFYQPPMRSLWREKAHNHRALTVQFHTSLLGLRVTQRAAIVLVLFCDAVHFSSVNWSGAQYYTAAFEQPPTETERSCFHLGRRPTPYRYLYRPRWTHPGNITDWISNSMPDQYGGNRLQKNPRCSKQKRHLP